MKAALWLLSVEEKLAVEVLAQLQEDEVRTLAEIAREIETTSPDDLERIHQEFRAMLDQEPLLLKGDIGYLGKIAGQALGEDRARRLLFSDGSTEVLPPTLDNADLDVLSSVLKLEHPQVVAAVLANLDPARAGEVLSRMPVQLQEQVITRVARLTRVSRSVLERTERLLSAGLPTRCVSDSALDGVRVAARLLNQIEQEAAQDVLESIDQNSEAIATKIRQAMFTFEDLASLDRRGFQTLLKEVQSDQLLVALKTASEEIRSSIFAALSKRAADMLREDLEVMGPVRLQEVQEAQQAVVNRGLTAQERRSFEHRGPGGR